LTSAIYETICGVNNWEAIARSGRTKQDCLKTWLELANGSRSPDPFSRVLARIDPAELQKCFIGWMAAVAQVTEGDIRRQRYWRVGTASDSAIFTDR
jgi:DDE_Tnp_1-associated